MEAFCILRYLSPQNPRQRGKLERPFASEWEEVADVLYQKMPDDEKKRFGILTRILFWGNRLKTKY